MVIKNLNLRHWAVDMIISGGINIYPAGGAVRLSARRSKGEQNWLSNIVIL